MGEHDHLHVEPDWREAQLGIVGIDQHGGLAPAQPGVDALVDDLAEHLRALLRDTLCGHLPLDLVRVADEVLDGEAAVPVATEA